MKNLSLLVSFAFISFSIQAQIENVDEKFTLPETVAESSGAIFFNGKLITHNDSGNENRLYEVDTISGAITRTVTITNAENKDWEDIAQDEEYIYIGDFGNNNGNRTDLKIYKIIKSDYLNDTNVTAEVISFSYKDQTDFTSNTNNTPWDAEALISFNENNLVLFSKNWVDNITLAYSIPKAVGDYQITALPNSLNSNGLITGATYNTYTNKLYLVGYSSNLQPFVWVVEGFTDSGFSNLNTQTQLTSLALEQVEGITFVNENRFFITSESFNVSVGGFTLSDTAKLISFSTNDTSLNNNDETLQNKYNVTVYPNPVKHSLNIDTVGFDYIELFGMHSKRLLISQDKQLDMQKYHQGVYLLKIHLDQGQTVFKRLVKI